MEQQVAEAARALVSPTTDPTTRSAASSFLEEWTRSPNAWDIYYKWLQSFVSNTVENEMLSIQLLCLTLLQGKIRREVRRGTPEIEVLRRIREQLWSLLQGQQDSAHGSLSPLSGQLCVTTAALAIRCGHTKGLVDTCRNSSSGYVQQAVALKLLASVPPEMEQCGDLTTPQVTQELWPHMEGILDTVRRSLGHSDTVRPALEVLQAWIQICHITLSHLNSPTCGGNETLLPTLIQILSQSEPQEEKLLILASQALQEAILIPSDIQSTHREQIVKQLVDAVSHGFVVAPFGFCTANRWDDAAHALASMIGSLVTEEIDELCIQPAEACLSLLLQIQNHPHTPVALTVLECWLTVQEIPTSDRHENWKAPLFLRVCESLVVRIAYTTSFTTWEEELDLDQQEFSDLRRMVGDVLVSAYFLLRVRFIQHMGSVIMRAESPWTAVEAGLASMCFASREICARTKARGASTMLTNDRDATVQELLRLLGHVCGGNSNSAVAVELAAKQHPLLLTAVSRFMGHFAPAWNVHCSGDALLQIMVYLRVAMRVPNSTETACIATRSILVACSGPLLASSAMEQCLTETMDAVLNSGHPDGMKSVVEGLTRLIIQIPQPQHSQHALHQLISPLLMKLDQSLNSSSSAQSIAEREIALEASRKYLGVLETVVRFCDVPENGVSPLATCIDSLMQMLEKTAEKALKGDQLLQELLAVQVRLLNNARGFMLPRFTDTVKFVIAIFEQTKDPSTLDYLSAAVEAFDPITDNSNIQSFTELHCHVSTNVHSYLSSEKNPKEATQLVRAFFELCQRYLMFCPSGLIGASTFPSNTALAIECLSACEGEKDSTRATLTFLSHLFGWKSLRLADHVKETMNSVSAAVDVQLGMHGERIVSLCVLGLSGGSPQMLWPALSDCLYAIVLHVISSNTGSPVAEEPTAAHAWVYNSLVQCKTKDGQSIPQEICQQIVRILFDLARNGTKAKAKAKMLLSDVGKICKGETGVESLLSYGLS